MFKRASWTNFEELGLDHLLAGDDSAATVALASVSKGSDDLDELLRDWGDEKGLEPPTLHEASAYLAQDLLDEIQAEQISPIAAAREFRSIGYNFPEVLAEAIGLEGQISEWEDAEISESTDYLEEISGLIVAELRDLTRGSLKME